MSRAVYVTYEEAQKLQPVFRRLREEAPWKEARESASRLLGELSLVKKGVDYELGGKQVLLEPIDYEFLMDVITQLDLR